MRTFFLKSILVGVLLAWLGVDVLAQADVDSPYSLFGVGQVRDKSMNVRLKGMGGTSNAIFGIGMINAENPASYAKIDSLAFLFDAGIYFKSSRFSTSSLSERSANASFDYVSMAFGLTSWWKMALGVQPFSAAGYTIVVNDNRPDIGNYATRFKGSGGLNQAFLGTAFKLGKEYSSSGFGRFMSHFSIGANGYYVFGNTMTETTLYFPDSLYMLGTRRSVDLMVSSFMADYGLLFDANLGEGLKMSIGATYTMPVNLRGKETLFIRSIEEDAETSIEYVIDTLVNTTASSKTRMPQGFGVGVAFQQSDRWTVAADFNWKQWSEFGRQGVSGELQDSWSVSVGAEFTPRHSTISNYFRRMTYRVGGFYEHGFISLLGNDGENYSIDKFGVDAGVSFPLPKTLSKIDVALEGGQYGTREGGLIQERYFRVNVGVSVFEHWFMKRKYR